MSDNKYETVQNNILDLQRSNENLHNTSQSTLLVLGKSLKALDKQNKKIEVLQEVDSDLRKDMQNVMKMNVKMLQWNLAQQKQQTEIQNQIFKLHNFSYNNYELFARLGTHLSDRIDSNCKNIQNIATNEATTINNVVGVLKDQSQKILALETATGKAALKNEKSRKALENKVQYDNKPFWKRNGFGFGKKTFDQQVSNKTLKEFEDTKKKEAKELQEKIDTLSGLEKHCKIEDVKIEEEDEKLIDDLRQMNNQIIQRQEEKKENQKRVSYIANNDKRHIALEIYNMKISTCYLNNTSGVISAIMDTLRKEVEQKEESKNLLKVFDAPLKSAVMLYLLKHHTNKDLHTEMDAISCFDTEFKKELDKGMSKEEIFDDIINDRSECIDYLMHIICLYLERPCVQIYNQRVNPLCMDKFANQPAFYLIMGKTHIYSTEYINDEEKQKLFKSNEYFPKSLYNKIGTKIKDTTFGVGGALVDSISDLVSTKGGSEKSQEMTRSMVRPIGEVPFNNHSYIEPFNNHYNNEVPFAKNSYCDNNMMGMMMINSNPGYHRVENFGGRIENV